MRCNRRGKSHRIGSGAGRWRALAGRGGTHCSGRNLRARFPNRSKSSAPESGQTRLTVGPTLGYKTVHGLNRFRGRGPFYPIDFWSNSGNAQVGFGSYRGPGHPASASCENVLRRSISAHPRFPQVGTVAYQFQRLYSLVETIGVSVGAETHDRPLYWWHVWQPCCPRVGVRFPLPDNSRS